MVLGKRGHGTRRLWGGLRGGGFGGEAAGAEVAVVEDEFFLKLVDHAAEGVEDGLVGGGVGGVTLEGGGVLGFEASQFGAGVGGLGGGF